MGATSVRKQVAFGAAAQGWAIGQSEGRGKSLDQKGSGSSTASVEKALCSMWDVVLLLNYMVWPPLESAVFTCPGRRLLSASSSAPMTATNQQCGLFHPSSAPGTSPVQELEEQGRRCRTDVGSRVRSSPSVAPAPLCHRGVRNLHLHQLGASPTCVCIVPAVGQQPSNCSGFTRGGTQQPRFKECLQH